MAAHVTNEYHPPRALQAPRRTPRRGDRIGRFTVLDVLGRGGMGVVLSAYDPGLDRRVALKLVRGKAAAAGQEETRARLLSEARAMARLRHPNVLTIYEAGEEDGRVYLAMEKIEGGSLRDRQTQLRRESPDGWRAILGLYLAAGRGLAAAHAAGIVHRDFKPDNVLVDRDGGVRVADFGLASASRPGARLARGTEPAEPPAPPDSAGAGTPGYAASEQYLGRPVDARADQFAFCVSLWEAIYGELPFCGRDHEAYARAVVDGRIRPPRDDRAAPAWIRAVLERGLKADPAERYPSMEALLAELDCDDPPAERGTRTAAMVALMVLFIALGGLPGVAGGKETLAGVATSLAAALAGLVAVALVLRARHQLTALNRRLLAVLFTPLVMSLAMTAAAAMLGLDAERTSMVLLILWSAMAATVAAALGVQLWSAGAAYAAAFVVSHLVPGALHVAIPAAHLALMVNAIAIWGTLAARGKTGSGSNLAP